MSDTVRERPDNSYKCNGINRIYSLTCWTDAPRSINSIFGMFALIMIRLVIESIDLLALQIENSMSNWFYHLCVCVRISLITGLFGVQPVKVSVIWQVCTLSVLSVILSLYSNLSGFDHIRIEIDLDNESRWMNATVGFRLLI